MLFVRGGGSDAASGYTYCSDLFGLLQDVMVVGEPTLMGGEFGDNCERLIHPVRPTRGSTGWGESLMSTIAFFVLCQGHDGGRLADSGGWQVRRHAWLTHSDILDIINASQYEAAAMWPLVTITVATCFVYYRK